MANVKNTINIPTTGDIEDALLALDGIGSILLGMAAAIDGGHPLESRALLFLSTSILDRVRSLADDLGMKVFWPKEAHGDGEARS